MLELERIDLSSLREALEDHSLETTWYFNPATGSTEPRMGEEFGLLDGAEEEEEERNLIPVDPIPSRVGYEDMLDFIERVPDPRARDLLERAVAGRGAFRRFKDTLFEFPELRESWFEFHDTRMERRAIRWLADEEIIDQAQAERAFEERPDPELEGAAGVLDAEAVARDVARDLRALYGGRLIDVVLFGSWARGDAHPESDIDLLVVLDRVDSPWAELRRMDDVLWRHSLQNDTVVTAVPVSVEEARRGDWPAVVRARAEGRSVA